MENIENSNFIVCQNEDVAEELFLKGYKLLYKNDANFIFINNYTLDFCDLSNKIVFTNRLTF